ncbi:hypothetical protein BDV18DRAFT_158455 [Aspergillus unguis]
MRCTRLNLACEWPPPKPSLASRRRGFGPIKTRDLGAWSPASIVPGDRDQDQGDSNLTPVSQGLLLPSPGQDLEDVLADSNGFLPDTSLVTFHDGSAEVSQHANLDSHNVNAFTLLRDPCLAIPNLSFACATGTTRSLGLNDKQAVQFHCEVFAPLKSTRKWNCSAHTLFLNKAYNRNMALHFLLAVSHSELAIHYGQGSEPPQESRDHYCRGSELLLQAHNPFAAPDHISMMLSFLYMYMFWMRREHLDPTKLRDLGRAVLSHVQTYRLDTLCASDDVLWSESSSGVITASEQVLLARIITYLHDRDGFCAFFGCGGHFAEYINSISQKRHRIWLRSRAVFFMPLNDVDYSAEGSEIEDAPTLDIYFELIILHQEINTYSQTSTVHAMGMKSKVQRHLDAIYKDKATFFDQVSNPDNNSKCSLMSFVTATVYYALRVYFYRARQSPFRTRPIPSDLENTLNSLVSAAYYATKTGQVQLLERFQWSLFMAGLETTDPVHLEWISSNISDPAIRKRFECCQAVRQSPGGGITMQKIRELTEGCTV